MLFTRCLPCGQRRQTYKRFCCRNVRVRANDVTVTVTQRHAPPFNTCIIYWRIQCAYKSSNQKKKEKWEKKTTTIAQAQTTPQAHAHMRHMYSMYGAAAWCFLFITWLYQRGGSSGGGGGSWGPTKTWSSYTNTVIWGHCVVRMRTLLRVVGL